MCSIVRVTVTVTTGGPNLLDTILNHATPMFFGPRPHSPGLNPRLATQRGANLDASQAVQTRFLLLETWLRLLLRRGTHNR